MTVNLYDLLERVETLEGKKGIFIGPIEPNNPFPGLVWINNQTQLVQIFSPPRSWIPLNAVTQESMVVNDWSATTNIDWSRGKVQYVELGGNTTFTFQTPKSGGRYLLIAKQDATGGRTLAFPAGVSWVNGATPTFVTTADTFIICSFVYDDVNSKYFAINSDGYT